ncbi:MarR family winged helix-turn-helix transcriptional regulator [Teredinibacter sp. KSP-S5-2]|uniref:MarR family winged helix-turn-helix transcriptional regulator n=1 Tax=Teredinibacter sp. KSP-S5-2 TaxID=3034506 RepID=UPI00397730ED
MSTQAGYNVDSIFTELGAYTLERIDEVLVSLRRVIRATDLHSKHLAKTTGLTAPQILVLQAVRDLSRTTIGLVANEVSLSQATVTTIIDRLEKKELVYRERSKEDKRKVHVYLTDSAYEILKTAPIPLQDHFARQFNDLQDWEKTMIISALQRVAQMMDAQHIDASPVLDVGTLDRQDTTLDGPIEYGDTLKYKKE